MNLNTYICLRLTVKLFHLKVSKWQNGYILTRLNFENRDSPSGHIEALPVFNELLHGGPHVVVESPRRTKLKILTPRTWTP